MKKQNLHFFLLVSILCCWLGSVDTNRIYAQNVLGSSGSLEFNSKQAVDYLIPDNANGKYLYLTLKGGAGGRVRAQTSGIWKAAGQGATVELVAKIGSGAKAIPPSSTIRFIVGEAGGDGKSGDADFDFGGGGGGTAVAFKGPNATDKWVLLAVAGGGSGATGDATARGNVGLPGGGISYTLPTATTGAGGKNTGNQQCINSSSPGGGAFSNGERVDYEQMLCKGSVYGGEAGWPGGPDQGEPTGGDGRFRGSWGFGGGGGNVSSGSSTGGGGGYTGGDNLMNDSEVAKAGTSFLHEEYAMGIYTNNGQTKSRYHGRIVYRIENTFDINFYAIKPVKNGDKCIQGEEGSTGNGANVQLGNCQAANFNSLWYFEDNYLKLGKVRNTCLSLKDHNAPNNSNIHLWNCESGNKNQIWFFDVMTQSIRSGQNFNKCLNLAAGSTADGTNIEIYDCATDSAPLNQQWSVESMLPALPAGTNQIFLLKDPTKCLNIQYANTADGTNIQLYQCHTSNNSQYFTFDGRSIKMQTTAGTGAEKCVNVSGGSEGNGTNINLTTCNDTDAQKWIYDGLAQAFRSNLNRNKCLSIKDADAHDGTNIHLWDCHVNDNQRFAIRPASQWIKPTKDDTKCLDADQANTANGTNIKLEDCQGNPAQRWVVDGSAIRLHKDQTKCLSLQDPDAANGSNVHLWDCKGVDHQLWFYDTQAQAIRSRSNYRKCLALDNAGTAGSNNLLVYDCPIDGSSVPQSWAVQRVPDQLPPGSNKRIRWSGGSNKCVDIAADSNDNGTNIQLYHCDTGNNSQYFTFHGRHIMKQSTVGRLAEKCLSVQDLVDDNGTNILLWDCKGKPNQGWIYDSFTQTLRSDLNWDKCLTIKEEDELDRANIYLWDCEDGNRYQRFEIRSGSQHIHLTADPTKCVDVNNANTDNGTNIKLDACQDDPAQQWSLQGSYIRLTKNVSKCLSVQDVQDTNGTNILLWDCKDKVNQRWTYDEGSHLFRSQINVKKCLSLKDSDAPIGTNIQLRDCDEGDVNQKFEVY